MPMDPEATVRAWSDAILRHAIDECLSLMSHDYVRYGDPSWDSPMTKNEWGAASRSFFAAFPDWRWETTSLFAFGETVILEASERGSWTKPWELFGSILEPSGATFEDKDAVFFVVKDGLITQSRVYITDNFSRVFKIEQKIAELLSDQG